MSPTKQGNSGGTQTPSGTEWRRKPWENPDSDSVSVLLRPMKDQCVIRAALQDKWDRNIKSICPFHLFGSGRDWFTTGIISSSTVSGTFNSTIVLYFCHKADFYFGVW